MKVASYSWFTPELRHLSNCLRSHRKKCTRTPTPYNVTKLKLMEERLLQESNLSKTTHERNLISLSAGNTSRVYKYIRSITGSSQLPPTVSLDSSLASSDLDRANLLNSYFHLVFTTNSSPLPPSEDLHLPSTTVNDITITECDVYKALTSLDPTKAMGTDGIGPKLLKHCALAITEPTYHLFCLSLSHQVIPNEWKFHQITPIHKSGDRSNVKNYRPISLLCVISKVLERIIYNNIIEFTTAKITVSQFGFLKSRSCTQQLLVSLADILNSINNMSQSDVVYLDFSKAFDTVAHNELLVKLHSLGITGNLWSWFRAYLTDRRQSVCVNNCLSTSLPVLSGVPQGSILGPLLFLVYINDLPSYASNSNLLLFADDTKCLKSITNLADCHKLQDDIDKLSLWCNQWRMKFNITKCVLLSFHSKQVKVIHSYQLNGQSINSCEVHRDLGILLSHNLTWSAHYNHITARAYRMLGLLRRTFSTTNSPITKKYLYISLVRSQLTYCSQVWRPNLMKDILTIETVQRRATKFILNDFSSDYRQRLISLELLPLMMEFELSDILFFVKSHKKPTPAFNILDYVSFSLCPTRSSTHHKMVHKLARTNTARHFDFCRLPRLWNSLPAIDLTLSYPCIRDKLRKLFWNHFLRNFDTNKNCSYHFLCPCYKCVCSRGHNVSALH